MSRQARKAAKYQQQQSAKSKGLIPQSAREETREISRFKEQSTSRTGRFPNGANYILTSIPITLQDANKRFQACIRSFTIKN